MKKLLILLVVAFALSFVAESAMAQGCWLFRQYRNPNLANANYDVAFNAPGSTRGAVVAPSTSGDEVCSGETIVVYRRTLCGDYREIGEICAEKICGEIPGDDYILVRKRFNRYYWVQACPMDQVAP